jgi:hypothetical protein
MACVSGLKNYNNARQQCMREGRSKTTWIRKPLTQDNNLQFVEAVEEEHSSHEVAEAVAEVVVEKVGVEVDSWLFVAVQCLGSGGNIVSCRENLVLWA